MKNVTEAASYESLGIDATTRRVLEKLIDAIPLTGDAFTGQFIAIAKRSVLEVVDCDSLALQRSLTALLNTSLGIGAIGNYDELRLLRTVWESDGDVIFGVDPEIAAWVGRQTATC